jgi:alpha-1,6-mannosyltransferase
MRHGKLLQLSFAIAAELVFFAILNCFDDWTIETMPVKFVEAAFLSGIAYLVAVSSFEIELGTRGKAMIFWGVAIALRLIALPLAPSDDLWRYQWEGKIQSAGLNPYVIAPDDPKLDEIRQSFPESHNINRNTRAMYPPGAELLFAAFNRISDRPLFYKFLFAMADLAAVALLLRLIGGNARHEAAAWYAWNPLVAYSFAGAAHFDSLMILPMLGGIIFLLRSEKTESREKWIGPLLAAICFGIAISINAVPVLLLLPCIFALRLRAIVLAIAVAIPALLSVPYGFPSVRMWNSIGELNHLTRLNDLFWWLIEETLWPNPHQMNYRYSVIIIGCAIVVSFLFVRNWKRGMLWVLGTALVLSPVFNPWYCTWILPLATWRRAYAWHVLSITVFAYYLFWDERLFQLPWHAEPWMHGLIIVPALAALVLFVKRKSDLPGSA